MAATTRRIILKGDRRHPEPEENYIEFPGGCIGVVRVKDEYWAHVMVNHQAAINDCEGLDGYLSSIVDSRIDYDDGTILEITNPEQARHFAIRIATKAS